MLKIEKDSTLRVVQKFEGVHDCDANCISCSPTKKGLVCSCGDDGTINLSSLVTK